MKKDVNMKRRVVRAVLHPVTLMLVVFFFLLLSCVQEPRKSIEGAWKLVYGHHMAGDTLQWRAPDGVTGSQIKMWTHNHYLFVGQFTVDTTVIDNYGGGTYTLAQNRYEETITYHGTEDWIGTSMKMVLEIKGDSLFQYWPADENWQIDKGNHQLEKYVRLD